MITDYKHLRDPKPKHGWRILEALFYAAVFMAGIFSDVIMKVLS